MQKRCQKCAEASPQSHIFQYIFVEYVRVFRQIACSTCHTSINKGKRTHMHISYKYMIGYMLVFSVHISNCSSLPDACSCLDKPNPKTRTQNRAKPQTTDAKDHIYISGFHFYHYTAMLEKWNQTKISTIRSSSSFAVFSSICTFSYVMRCSTISE